MITVEWYDHSASKHRSGKLLQVSPTSRDPVNIAFVITERLDSDPWSGKMGPGDKIIVPVKLANIIVKGVEVPLFGDQ